jgi:hypothetical protein
MQAGGKVVKGREGNVKGRKGVVKAEVGAGKR